MSAEDFWGYSRDVHAPGEVISSQTAAIYLTSGSGGDAASGVLGAANALAGTLGDGGERVALSQNMSINYSHQVKPVFDIGSSDLYWLTGKPGGTAQISRLVSKDGFFSSWNIGNACATVQTIKVVMEDGNECFSVEANDGVKMANSMAESISLSISAGQMEVQEGMTVRIGELSAAGQGGSSGALSSVTDALNNVNTIAGAL